ncbi:MAG TPA: Calx-beta domain-containing protein, partial [Verrucomicrobiae bacterium]
MKTHNPVHMVCARPCSLLLLGLAGWLAGISQSAAQSPPTLQIYGPYGVSENAGTLTVGIGLTPPSTQPVSVSFATIDGTAHAGTDYGARNGTITFQPGENFKNISVPIFDNGQVDGSRYFSIQFSNVEGALLPSYSSSLFLSISDNELPNIVATSFNPGSGVYGYDETIGTVKKLVLQPDGKVLIGGDFNTVAGNLRKGFARLNSNGSYDTNFNFGAGTDGKVQALALQPNGQILVGGQFATVNGLGHANLARINPDGTVENSFTASTDDSGVVYSLVVQPDGRVLVGGNFQKVNGSSRYCLARLLPSGALDSAFQVSAITNMYVRGLALLPDGRIAVACNATNAYLNTYIAQRVLLLNSDGSVDPSFVAAGPYAYDDLSGIALQPTTGKLLVYGAFGYFSGQYRNSGLVRLNMDGSVDALFNPYVGFLPVQDLAFRPDGSMIVVGNDKSSFPVPSYYSPLVLTSLNAAGGFEPNITSVQADNPINAVAIQPDGRILVGGSFTAINSVSRVGIARLDFQGTTGNAFNFTKATFTGHEEDAGTTIQIQRLGSSTAAASVTFSTSDGTAQSTLDYIGQTNVITFAPLEVQKSIFIPLLDDSLVERDETVQLKLTNPSASAEVGAQGIATLVIQQEERPVLVDTSFNPGTGANRKVYAIARQPDGKLIIGGQFVTINGMPRNYIARLNTNGTVDQSFNVGTGPNSYVRALALQPDGKVILGGQFWSVNGISHYGVARLNTDGSLDTNFNATIYGGGEVVNSLALQPNGQVLVAGTFYAVNGYNSYYLTRLNSDGSLDQAFSISNASKPSITLASVALQSDGKILAGGYYSAALLRFQSDGSWDTNFAPAGLSFTNNYFNYGRIKALKVLSNDHILVGGLFREPHRNIARLNPDGSLDSNFNPGTGANNSVNVIALDAGGKLVIGGEFFSYNDTASRRLARLNGDGSLDFTFNPGTGVNDEIQDILIQPDNKYVLGGEFSAVNGINLDHIARVYGYPVSFQSISWSDIDLSVHESSGAQSLTLRRYGSSSNTISASYSTADVTAHSGVDYIAQSGTITLGPLETTKSISIAVIDDGLPEEENEFFQVVASPVTPGLEQGLNTVATVTIKDSQTPLYQDHSLNVNYSPYGNLNTVLVQSDGKFLAGGLFYYPNGPTNMARFNSDGSLDKSFLATGTDGEVRVITFDLDGNLLVGGSFVQMNGSSARFLARL